MVYIMYNPHFRRHVLALLRKGLSKTEIASLVARSEHWVRRWWREQPATLERPAGARDVVLKKASVHAFRDLEIRRVSAEDRSCASKTWQ